MSKKIMCNHYQTTYQNTVAIFQASNNNMFLNIEEMVKAKCYRDPYKRNIRFGACFNRDHTKSTIPAMQNSWVHTLTIKRTPTA